MLVLWLASGVLSASATAATSRPRGGSGAFRMRHQAMRQDEPEEIDYGTLDLVKSVLEKRDAPVEPVVEVTEATPPEIDIPVAALFEPPVVAPKPRKAKAKPVRPLRPDELAALGAAPPERMYSLEVLLLLAA